MTRRESGMLSDGFSEAIPGRIAGTVHAENPRRFFQRFHTMPNANALLQMEPQPQINRPPYPTFRNLPHEQPCAFSDDMQAASD